MAKLIGGRKRMDERKKVNGKKGNIRIISIKDITKTG